MKTNKFLRYTITGIFILCSLIVAGMWSILIFAPGILPQSKDKNEQPSISNNDSKVTEPQVPVDNQAQNESKVAFSYEEKTGTLRYAGTVDAMNGCGEVANQKLVEETGKIILQVTLKYTGEICTQVIKSLPVEGSKEILLSREQAANLEAITSVQVQSEIEQ